MLLVVSFPSISHNEIRDLTASLLSEMCCDVGFELALQPLVRNPLRYATANSEDGAHLDVVARDFWRQNRQRAFFDVWVFNPFAHSYSCLLLSRYYLVHEHIVHRRNIKYMMNGFERWKELVSPL